MRCLGLGGGGLYSSTSQSVLDSEELGSGIGGLEVKGGVDK